jgi:hypothetical protein
MTVKVSLREQLAAFKAGNIMDADGTVTFCFNFFDWFCHDSSLENKANKLFPRVKTFAEKMGVNLDTTYCIFKNNCPVGGQLYDDFRICDRETGHVIWTVVPKCGHSGQAEVWGTINSFQGAHLQGPTLSAIYKDLPH